MYMVTGMLLALMLLWQGGAANKGMEQLQKEICKMEFTLNRLETDGARLSKEVTSLEQNHRKMPELQEDTPRFVACLSEDTNVDGGENIIFDRVQLPHPAYNNNTGLFTCPLNGHYVFHVTVRHGGGDVNADMYHDNTVIANAGARDSGVELRTGSASANIYCVAGQQVFVRVRENSPVRGTEFCSTVFSGHLIQWEA